MCPVTPTDCCVASYTAVMDRLPLALGVTPFLDRSVMCVGLNVFRVIVLHRVREMLYTRLVMFIPSMLHNV